MNTRKCSNLLFFALGIAAILTPIHDAMGSSTAALRAEVAKRDWASVLEKPVNFKRSIANQLGAAIAASPTQKRALLRPGKMLSIQTVEDVIHLRRIFLDADLVGAIAENLKSVMGESLPLSMSETDVAMLKYYDRLSPHLPADSYLEKVPGVSERAAMAFAQERVDTIADAMSRSAEYWQTRLPQKLVENVRDSLYRVNRQMFKTDVEFINSLRPGHGHYLTDHGISQATIDLLTPLRIVRIGDLKRLNSDMLEEHVPDVVERAKIMLLMKKYLIRTFGSARLRAEAAAEQWGESIPKNSPLGSVCKAFVLPIF